jgi:hypothetical protein
MEGWKDGRMEGWKDGRVEKWKNGKCVNSAIRQWNNGIME